MDTQKISVCDQTNCLQFTDIKSDSFTVDMERLSHLTDEDKTSNSRINLQRNLSRKGSQQLAHEKKIHPSSTANDRETEIHPPSTAIDRDTSTDSMASPRAALAESSTPKKPMVGVVRTTDHPINSRQVHQITILAGKIDGGATAKRFSFRRSPPFWPINPRRILFFFATLSSMGTILLIYFTLSMGKLSGDDNALSG